MPGQSNPGGVIQGDVAALHDTAMNAAAHTQLTQSRNKKGEGSEAFISCLMPFRQSGGRGGYELQRGS